MCVTSRGSFDRCCVFPIAVASTITAVWWWGSPFLPGAKIGMAHVDLEIVDVAALGSTVSSDGPTPSFLRLKCGAPLVVSAVVPESCLNSLLVPRVPLPVPRVDIAADHHNNTRRCTQGDAPST